MLEFAVNPSNVVEVCYHLYNDQFSAAKITEDEFADLCGAEETETLRNEVTQQMGSFSKFWRILSTEMETLQGGDTSLLERLAEATVSRQGASGPSS